MIQSKTEGINKEFIQLADMARALSHPMRIKILEILAEKKTCICGEIVDLLPLSQSTVSQHLKELKRAGFIRGEIEGPKTCYCLNPETVEKSKKMFTELFSKVCQCGGLIDSKGDFQCPTEKV